MFGWFKKTQEIEKITERTIEKEVTVPKEIIVEKVVEVPKEVIIEKVVEVHRDVPHIKRKQGGFRRGMWVDYQGRVGILFRPDGDKYEVHLVAQDGTTEEVVKASLSDLQQARKSQVPECRRGAIDNFDYQE